MYFDYSFDKEWFAGMYPDVVLYVYCPSYVSFGLHKAFDSVLLFKYCEECVYVLLVWCCD